MDLNEDEKKKKKKKEKEKVWNFCNMPFWQSNSTGSSLSSSPSSNRAYRQSQVVGPITTNVGSYSNKISSMVMSLLPARRRLCLDPPNKLYFPYERGKQVKSAISIKNTSKSCVAFKFQTNAPKSCYMCPPGGIIAPGESLIATVFKFVEQPENNEKQIGQRSGVKFKLMSLKVKGDMNYIPELFDEQRDQVAVEKILRVVFLDPKHPCPALHKLNQQLAEAEAAIEARKKPPEHEGPPIAGEGLVIDEWKKRRERYLAQKQVKRVDSA
ncbi:Vesicle-associated protein 4-2 [Camellia lanceoleosa]|uniref:Vesicle-associated protein 4-2 n=1 Tax=Camellia lanceoleosa TaxID=1840588 RepID=A0ACC0HCL3_9ERIC|nr:Vesicle-associated protein 4-2 [Camellia lanceoleosa]